MSAKLKMTMVAAMAAAFLASHADAAIILSIDQVFTPPGVTVNVGVRAVSSSFDQISGFNLPLDINNDGFVDANTDLHGELPAGFTLGTPQLANAIYGNTGYDEPQPQIQLINVDAIPTGSGLNTQLSTVPTKLFDIVVKVAANVPVGTILPFEIIVPPAPFSALFNVAGPASPLVSAPVLGTPVTGFIQITPEPSVAALVLGVAALRRVRRRR